MSARRLYVTVGTLLLGLSATASQAAPVSLDVTIGGQALSSGPASWVTESDGQTHTLVNPLTWSTSDGNSSFTLNGGGTQWDADPMVLFSASATNHTSTTQTYTFTFTEQMNPHLLGAVASHAQLGVTLTDGGNNVVSLSPTTGLYMLTSFDRYADNTPISKNVDVGAAVNVEGLSSFVADSSLVCAQDCVSMYATLSFTLSAGDSVGFSGKVTQTAVPLPAAGLLLGSGLMGLLGIGRRRRRIV